MTLSLPAVIPLVAADDAPCEPEGLSPVCFVFWLDGNLFEGTYALTGAVFRAPIAYLHTTDIPISLTVDDIHIDEEVPVRCFSTHDNGMDCPGNVRSTGRVSLYEPTFERIGEIEITVKALYLGYCVKYEGGHNCGSQVTPYEVVPDLDLNLGQG
jgi:hypothetical protein